MCLFNKPLFIAWQLKKKVGGASSAKGVASKVRNNISYISRQPRGWSVERRIPHLTKPTRWLHLVRTAPAEPQKTHTSLGTIRNDPSSTAVACSAAAELLLGMSTARKATQVKYRGRSSGQPQESFCEFPQARREKNKTKPQEHLSKQKNDAGQAVGIFSGLVSIQATRRRNISDFVSC